VIGFCSFPFCKGILKKTLNREMRWGVGTFKLFLFVRNVIFLWGVRVCLKGWSFFFPFYTGDVS
jgi:hypothetical protein